MFIEKTLFWNRLQISTKLVPFTPLYLSGYIKISLLKLSLSKFPGKSSLLFLLLETSLFYVNIY